MAFPLKPFEEALSRIRRQGVLPTSAGTYGLEQIPAAIRERSFFSARVVNAQTLQRFYELLDQAIAGGKQDSSGNYVPGSGIDMATFRAAAKDYLKAIDYAPPEGESGSLKDLSSDQRLEVIYRTNVEMAQGYGAYMQQQDPAALDSFPAQELYRLESRMQPRAWGQRWNEAIQALGVANTSAQYVDDPYANDGMFALVNDPIWTAISRFGLPYPPFDFNSGMWVRDIDRLQAEDLGLLPVGAPPPTPQPRDFNADLQAPIGDLAPDLQAALAAFGTIIDGVFHLSNSDPRFLSNFGTHNGNIKGWITRKGGSWTPSQRISAKNGLRSYTEILATHKDIYGAMHRTDIGPIDFRWGDENSGIAHIISRRKAQNAALPKRYRLPPKDVMKRVIITISKGKITREGNRKIEIEHKGYRAILAKDWKGKPTSHWVLSGLKIEK